MLSINSQHLHYRAELEVDTWKLNAYHEPFVHKAPPPIIPFYDIQCQIICGRISTTSPNIWMTTTLDRVCIFLVHFTDQESSLLSSILCLMMKILKIMTTMKTIVLNKQSICSCVQSQTHIVIAVLEYNRTCQNFLCEQMNIT